MANVLDQLGTYLEDNGVGTLGTDLYLGNVPGSLNAPDNVITVVDTGGAGASRHFPSRTLTFQIKVRNTNYDTGMTKAQTIRDLLHGDDNNILTDFNLKSGGERVLTTHALQEPHNLGLDENDRYVIVANYALTLDN